MNLYSLNEANYSISYYENKVVGQKLESSGKAIVEKLDKEDYGDNTYRVNAIGQMLPGFFIPKRSIDLVAKDLNLSLPEDVLKDFTPHP